MSQYRLPSQLCMSAMMIIDFVQVFHVTLKSSLLFFYQLMFKLYFQQCMSAMMIIIDVSRVTLKSSLLTFLSNGCQHFVGSSSSETRKL